MSHFQSEFQIKKLICEMGSRMYMRGFVAANDGNISVRISDNEVIATPTGVSKGFMTPDMLCKIDMNGKVIRGTTKPSSEIKMHLRIYKENPKIKAVTHAHPPFATSFAIARTPMDRALLPEAIVNLGIVPVADYATPGTDEVPESIAKYIKNYNSVLLANHGVVTWGKDVVEAFYRLETVEHYGKVLLYTQLLGKAKELSCNDVNELIGIRENLGIDAGGIPSKCNTNIQHQSVTSHDKTETTLNEDRIIQQVTKAVLAKLNGERG